ncbi:MAG: SpoIIE family protein phosphatase [Bacteroidales bacterium]|nr:SpoIIE family protein phosphatase [Bacteroidales bacterium]
MTHHKTKILAISIIIIATLASAVARAQYEMMFHSIDEQNGMSNEVVTCIEVDAFGYVWIGTKTGLERYDGLSFVQMSSSKYKSTLNTAIGNSVADIKRDLEDNIWIATEKGVSKFDIYTDRFSFIPRHGSVGVVNAKSYQADNLYVDNDNNTYYFSQYHGLHKYDPSSGSFRPVFNVFFRNHEIRYCHKDASDCFWMLSEKENSIYKVDINGETLREIPCGDLGDKNPTKGSYCFLDNGDGNYFFGGDNGLIVYDEKKGVFRDFDADNIEILPTQDIRSIFRDSRGTYWIGSMSKGLFKCAKGSRHLQEILSSPTRSPFYINSPTTSDICEDKQGLVWFGTWKGLSYMSLHPQKGFHNMYSTSSAVIPEKRFVSAFASHGDTIAIGTYGGGIIFWRKGESSPLAVFEAKESKGGKIAMSSVHAAVFDKNGYCYNGGYNRSLTRIHPDLKTVDEYRADRRNPNALQSDHTVSLLCDSKNRIWVLTNGDGLYLLENPEKGIFRNVNKGADGSSIASVWGISLAEYEGKILVGTYQGLSVYDPANRIYTNYESDDFDSTSLSHNWVVNFCIDNKERIWVATNAGFDLFDIATGKFTTYDTDCGLLSDVIQGIVADDKTGYLWVSTAKGISKFDPKKGVVLRTYLSSDGMLADNFLQRSAFKDKDGTMYFGASNGFTYFNPSEIRIDSLLPMPTITRLMLEYDDNVRNKRQLDTILSDKAPEATDRIVLDSKRGKTIIIQFATLNYAGEAGCKYSYMLQADGEPGRWVDIGTRHEAVFTNLDYGNYVFMIKCRNADGVESEVRPLRITVERPFWQHPLMISLAALVFLGFIGVLIWIRSRRNKQREKDLEQTVKKRTEDLVMANVTLEIQKEEVEKSLNSTLILNDLSRQITSSFDTLTIIMTAYNHIKMMVKMDLFAIGKYIHSNDTIEFNHIYLNGQQKDPVQFDIYEDNTEAKCFRSNEDAYSGECSNHIDAEKSRFYTVDEQKHGSVFVLPLRETSKPNGVLTIGCQSKDAYTNSDRANIRMIASYLSIALEKAKDYHQLQLKNNAINGSIRYAKTIQDAILVHETFINVYFNAMIIFRPKDIVSGDFYWFKTIGADHQNPDKIFAAVIDCTGHGVPGAFMSLISNILLNDIIIRNHEYEPDVILAMLDKEIVNALNQANNNNEDGLDMALCRFDRNEAGKYHDVVYAGAKNSLYHYKAAEQKTDTIAADRISIGGFNNTIDKKFTSHHVTVQPGDALYMTSDGIIDQNNVERKRFGRVRFVKTIEYNGQLDMQERKQVIEENLDEFMEGVEQRDDITIMGLKIS